MLSHLALTRRLQIEQSLAQPNLDPTFRATLLKKWHDSGVQASITSRWVCSESSDVRRNARVMEFRARADAAAHGFRACASVVCKSGDERAGIQGVS